MGGNFKRDYRGQLCNKSGTFNWCMSLSPFLYHSRHVSSKYTRSIIETTHVSAQATTWAPIFTDFGWAASSQLPTARKYAQFNAIIEWDRKLGRRKHENRIILWRRKIRSNEKWISWSAMKVYNVIYWCKRHFHKFALAVCARCKMLANSRGERRKLVRKIQRFCLNLRFMMFGCP